MRHDGVEGAPVLLVGIEALVQKLPQQAAILRWTKRINVTRGDRDVLPILDRGSEVPQRGETDTGDDRPGGLIAQFVEMAGLKAPLR